MERETEGEHLRILIQTLGSAGDTHPFIGVGRALIERGHEVTLLANEVFGEAIAAAGLGFVEMGGASTYRNLAANPEVWESRRGLELIFGATVDHLGEAVELIENELDGVHVLVNSTLGFGARVVRELHDVPLVTAHLAPSLFRSIERMPKTEIMWVGDDSPAWLKRLWWRTGDFLADRVIAPKLNAFRRTRGLEPVRRVLEDWAIYSPDTTLGLFPAWFGPPQPDWAHPVELTGFPLYDESERIPLSGELDSWLSGGDAPIVVTAGSANLHAREFFATAAAGCEELGVRAVLVTSNGDDIPVGLPASIRHEAYVPFSHLLPRAMALISNGGIGTCAQALAAGIPHLVTHVNFDQRDNGSRLEDLTAGLVMPVDDFAGDAAVDSIRRLLGPDLAAAARELSTRIDGSTARARAAKAVEAAARP